MPMEYMNEEARRRAAGNSSAPCFSEGDWPEKSEIESPEDTAVKRLLRAAKQVASRASIANDDEDELAVEFEQAIEDVEAFYETDDPQSNGWVGGNGLP